MTKKFWRQGEPFVWATGLALSLILFLTLLLFYVVLANGLTVFWPKQVALATLVDGRHLLGEIVQEEVIPHTEKKRLQFKIGNRDLYGLDFKWVDAAEITSLTYPKEVQVLERQEYGNFYGFLSELEVKGIAPPASGSNSLAQTIDALEARKAEVHLLGKKIAEEVRVHIRNIRRDILEEAKKAQKASHMTEDEAKKSHDEIQKLTDTYILKVDEIVKKKEAEITEI